MLSLRRQFWNAFRLALLGVSLAATTRTALAMDTLVLGVAASEEEHALTAVRGESVTGGLGEPARRLLPPAGPGYEGGRIAFTMAVDPARPTYLTARFWGSDRTTTDLILFCEGRQVGYRHLGDVDLLSIGNGSPPVAGRYFYVTTPLPESMTKGKTRVHLEVRGYGRVYGYATTFADYQKPMTEPTRDIFRLYTHTDPCFMPPADEKQGQAPADPPVRTAPGAEVLEAVKQRVEKEVRSILARGVPDQQQLWFLARAYHQPWTSAYHNPAVVQLAVRTLDAAYMDYKNDPATTHAGKAIYNNSWFGIGPAANTFVLLAEPLKGSLDAPVEGVTGTSRRAGWAAMFVECRDWHRANRRQYTNQSMINDTYGIYLPNRAVALLDPSRALAEPDALRYLYESAGLQPWLGSEKNGRPERPLGVDYLQLTAQGLTRELGFVGYYGEVIDWMTSMYDATRPAPGQPGDAKLGAQLVKAARARAVFRYPGLDDQGNRAMRAETVVGWRDPDHYPGDVTYTQRPTWDASSLGSAATTLDPVLLGGVQQMFADNQFFSTLEGQLKTGGLRTTAGLLEVPAEYDLVRRQPASDHWLPMSPGAPDSVFSDEEDGVVAIKHGADILYASLYWRARHAVNFLARVHLIRPDLEHVAVVSEDIRFTPGGQTYHRPDWVNFGFGSGGFRYPGDLHSAHAGEALPIARVPEGMAFRAGDENPYAGRGDFYTLRYGPYLIGMNMTTDRTFDLALPEGEGTPEALNGPALSAGATVRKVGPRSTAVFYVGAATLAASR